MINLCQKNLFKLKVGLELMKSWIIVTFKFNVDEFLDDESYKENFNN